MPLIPIIGFLALVFSAIYFYGGCSEYLSAKHGVQQSTEQTVDFQNACKLFILAFVLLIVGSVSAIITAIALSRAW